MNNIEQYAINISAPNLLNVCVDQMKDGELSGRLYHCYRESAFELTNIVELLKEAEQLFDKISYPQASTRTRSFVENGTTLQTVRPDKVKEQRELFEHRGECGSFMVFVKFRQNSTWQGEMVWLEKNEKRRFSNTLDFVKIIDYTLKKG